MHQIVKMIRKVVHITLVILLLATSTGITIYAHYCGSTFKSISVDVVHDSCCEGNCKDCHNEVLNFKIHDDFSTTAYNFAFQLFSTDLAPVQYIFDEQQKDTPQQAFHVINSPPPLSGRSLLVSICVFRI